MARSLGLKRTGMARFVVLDDEIDRARRMLGIKSPVMVTPTSYPRSRLKGRYVTMRNGAHRISISRDLSPRQASATIWHELAHALQAEQLGGSKELYRRWWKEAAAAGITREQVRTGTVSGRRYDAMPLESQAIAIARMQRRWRLTAA